MMVQSKDDPRDTIDGLRKRIKEVPELEGVLEEIEQSASYYNDIDGIELSKLPYSSEPELIGERWKNDL